MHPSAASTRTEPLLAVSQQHGLDEALREPTLFSNAHVERLQRSAERRFDRLWIGRLGIPCAAMHLYFYCRRKLPQKLADVNRSEA